MSFVLDGVDLYTRAGETYLSSSIRKSTVNGAETFNLVGCLLEPAMDSRYHTGNWVTCLDFLIK
ncbi:hypothetical protein OROMI_033902 [Orobanche minor]